MKVWLEPVALAKTIGFRRSKIHGIISMAADHRAHLLEAWHGGVVGSDTGSLGISEIGKLNNTCSELHIGAEE